VAWPHPFFIRNSLPDGKAVAASMPVMLHRYERDGEKQQENSQPTQVHLQRSCELECGPMPNVMAALPNIIGALC